MEAYKYSKLMKRSESLENITKKTRVPFDNKPNFLDFFTVYLTGDTSNESVVQELKKVIGIFDSKYGVKFNPLQKGTGEGYYYTATEDESIDLRIEANQENNTAVLSVFPAPLVRGMSSIEYNVIDKTLRQIYNLDLNSKNQLKNKK